MDLLQLILLISTIPRKSRLISYMKSSYMCISKEMNEINYMKSIYLPREGQSGAIKAASPEKTSMPPKVELPEVWLSLFDAQGVGKLAEFRLNRQLRVLQLHNCQ